MKLLTWNIKHGGSSRINNILQTLVNHDPDLIVLTEFRVKNELQMRSVTLQGLDALPCVSLAQVYSN